MTREAVFTRFRSSVRQSQPGRQCARMKAPPGDCGRQERRALYLWAFVCQRRNRWYVHGFAAPFTALGQEPHPSPTRAAKKGRCGLQSAHRMVRHHPLVPRRSFGGVPEWLNGTVSKTVVRASVPRVRIPPPPPIYLEEYFYRSGSGRIFLLLPRVMREGLSTGPGSRRPGSGLSGAIFSGPHDCGDLVNFAQCAER